MPLDLHLLPLHRRDGQDQPDLPGLFAAEAPRRAARSRKGDIILLHLILGGTATIHPDGQTQLLENLANEYFNSSGAVTTALRAAVDGLNQFLLDRNLTSAASGLQATGIFTALVLHGGQLYTAQSGPNHVFTIHADRAQHLHDPDLTGRGLGLSRTATAHFKHADLAAGDLIILTPAPPAAWKADALQKAHNRGMSTIHRVLINAAGPDLNAVLIQARTGHGSVKILNRNHLGDERPTPPVPPPPAGGAKGGVRPPQTEPDSVHQAASPPEISPAPAEPADPPPPRKERPPRPPRPVGPMILAVLRAFYTSLKTIGYSIRSSITRLLPGSELFTLPSSTMAFIAIAVPVMLVTLAAVVYVRRGQAGQFDEYIQSAHEAADFAATQTDPDNIRLAWEAVIELMDKAEAWKVTEETQALRIQAYASLDPLEGINRLDFQPALNGPLDQSVSISQMVATRDELYLLDTTSGSVIRTWLSGRGYEIDTTFKCGSGSYGSYLVGKLIDMAALPANNSLGASIMAMDANGIIVYCQVDDPPKAFPLTPPDSNWGSPVGFAIDSGALYVLDPQTSAVWIYSGADYTYASPPSLFFDDDVPQILDVIDFAVDLDDLYMLHADGQITTCVFGFAGQSTTCTSPALFGETRAGREGGPTLEGATFSGILFTPPPDPSIYLLDPGQSAVYHLSQRLNFQRQFRALQTDAQAGPSTAFAVSPSRSLFLARGSVIVWAVMP